MYHLRIPGNFKITEGAIIKQMDHLRKVINDAKALWSGVIIEAVSIAPVGKCVDAAECELALGASEADAVIRSHGPLRLWGAMSGGCVLLCTGWTCPLFLVAFALCARSFALLQGWSGAEVGVGMLRGRGALGFLVVGFSVSKFRSFLVSQFPRFTNFDL